MYDNLKSPGRNDECWCGSGRKYKKCHLDFDERLQSLYEQGFEVPQRSLLKTPEEIEGIKRSAAINIGVLDLVAERIERASPPRRSTSGSTITPSSTAASRPTLITRVTRKAFARPSTRSSAMASRLPMMC